MQTQTKTPWLFRSSIFKAFEGYQVLDTKENTDKMEIRVILEKKRDGERLCHCCSTALQGNKDYYPSRIRHLRIFGFLVWVEFRREKAWCPECKKNRSEKVSFLSEWSPHLSEEMALWINRLSEITSIVSISRLESIDKMACYQVDKAILQRMAEGYKIPDVTRISVDEVYARRTKEEGEDRDDLFLTVIVDLKTHKVIWVTKSRKKRALDEFFELFGKEACKEIKVVAADQHQGYADSVKEYCPQATLVWDRFHLVQNFNKALNEDRKIELASQRKNSEARELLQGKHRHIFLTKADRRTKAQQQHIDDVMKRNEKMAKLELIKEHFFKVFDSDNVEDVFLMMAECYQWALEVKAENVWKFIASIRHEKSFLNYFAERVTTAISEGINNVIKALKRVAFGYKDMDYFKLKILQRCGYLNSKYTSAA